jgi:hypothetical protein
MDSGKMQSKIGKLLHYLYKKVVFVKKDDGILSCAVRNETSSFRLFPFPFFRLYPESIFSLYSGVFRLEKNSLR